MVQNKGGWNIIIFLVVMMFIVLLVHNCFTITSHLYMMSRQRYRYHQEIRLLEGLLRYGIQVCKENKELLLRWGAYDTQTMHLDFDSWPVACKQPLIGGYAGSVSITSERGIMHVHAQLAIGNGDSMEGSCDISPADSKNPKGRLRIVHWSLGKG